MLPRRVLSRIRNLRKAEEVKRLLRLDRYWRHEVVKALLARSDEVVAFDSDLGFEIAIAADQLAHRLQSSSADLLAHAKCAVAVAHRHLGRMVEATTWMADARRNSARASAKIQAMVARQHAIMLHVQGNDDEALRQVRWAASTDQQCGVLPSISRTFEGYLHAAGGRFGEAVECFGEVLATENPRKPIYLVAIQNLAAALALGARGIEEVVQARRILKTVRARIKGVRDTPIRYRVCWAEAILHRRLEEFSPALDAMLRARKGFLRLGMAHDFALLSTELASLYLEMAQPQRARLLLLQTHSALGALDDALLSGAFNRACASEDLPAAVADLRSQLDPTPQSPACEQP